MKVSYDCSCLVKAACFAFTLIPESEFERKFLEQIPSRNFTAWRNGTDDGGGNTKTLDLRCMKKEA